MVETKNKRNKLRKWLIIGPSTTLPKSCLFIKKIKNKIVNKNLPKLSKKANKVFFFKPLKTEEFTGVNVHKGMVRAVHFKKGVNSVF